MKALAEPRAKKPSGAPPSVALDSGVGRGLERGGRLLSPEPRPEPETRADHRFAAVRVHAPPAAQPPEIQLAAVDEAATQAAVDPSCPAPMPCAALPPGDFRNTYFNARNAANVLVGEAILSIEEYRASGARSSTGAAFESVFQDFFGPVDDSKLATLVTVLKDARAVIENMDGSQATVCGPCAEDSPEDCSSGVIAVSEGGSKKMEFCPPFFRKENTFVRDPALKRQNILRNMIRPTGTVVHEAVHTAGRSGGLDIYRDSRVFELLSVLPGQYSLENADSIATFAVTAAYARQHGKLLRGQLTLLLDPAELAASFHGPRQDTFLGFGEKEGMARAAVGLGTFWLRESKDRIDKLVKISDSASRKTMEIARNTTKALVQSQLITGLGPDETRGLRDTDFQRSFKKTVLPILARNQSPLRSMRTTLDAMFELIRTDIVFEQAGATPADAGSDAGPAGGAGGPSTVRIPATAVPGGLGDQPQLPKEELVRAAEAVMSEAALSAGALRVPKDEFGRFLKRDFYLNQGGQLFT